MVNAIERLKINAILCKFISFLFRHYQNVWEGTKKRCESFIYLLIVVMKNRNLDHKDDWKTPKDFYDKLNAEFNFDFDPCPYMHDMSWDWLEVEWGGVNFVNPPYSLELKTAFVKKAIEESKKWKTCVLLIPVSTSTKLFHDYILPNKKEIRFIRWRIKFSWYNSKWEYVDSKCGMHDYGRCFR